MLKAYLSIQVFSLSAFIINLSLPMQDTESDPGWLGLACETIVCSIVDI